MNQTFEIHDSLSHDESRKGVDALLSSTFIYLWNRQEDTSSPGKIDFSDLELKRGF